MKRAIIVGAGYGGMALANLLGKAGYTVDVYDKNAQLGGRIAAVQQDGFTFDLGPSWYLMPEVFDQYYALFGEQADARLELQRFSPGYQVFFQSHDPVLIHGDLAQDIATFEQIESGAGARLKHYVNRSTQTYEVSLRYFLYDNFLRLGNFLRPAVLRHAGRMGAMAFRHLDSYVGRDFRDQRLRQILEYHMVFLGSSPFQAPAIYSLMSHLDFRSGVYYPKRGMLSLADDMQALGKHYGITYHTDAPVAEIIVEENRAVGIRLVNGTEARADIVISNADLHFTETQLVPAQYQSFPEAYWERRQPGPGAMLISLGIKGALPDLLHHNLYFVDEWRDNFQAIYEDARLPEHASMYICNPTKTDPSLAPAGHENIFILIPLPAGVTMTPEEQSRCYDRAVATLAKLTHTPDVAQRIVSSHVFGPTDFASTFNAWQYNAFGGESHILKQSVLFRTPNQSRKLQGLYYVGAGTVPGIGLPMCLISAQLTFKRITGNTSPGPLTENDL